MGLDMKSALVQFRCDAGATFGRAFEDFEHLVDDVYAKASTMKERHQVKEYVYGVLVDVRAYLRQKRFHYTKSLQGKDKK